MRGSHELVCQLLMHALSLRAAAALAGSGLVSLRVAGRIRTVCYQWI